MISVVIPTFNDEAVLGRALGPLVPAAIAGLVSEVIVVDGGSTDATLKVADDAGARILASDGDRGARLRMGCEAARAAWLMVLDPRGWLEPAWQEVASGHIQAHPTDAGYFPVAFGGWLGRFMRTQDDALLVPASRRQVLLTAPGRLHARRLAARLFLAEPRA